jgi:predicted RNA-binding Zn-ribbon protein involved in translation (DUF1610 family)
MGPPPLPPPPLPPVSASQLIACAECGHRISKAAKACPSCGAPNMKEVFRSRRMGCGIVLVLILAIWIVGKLFYAQGFQFQPGAEAADQLGALIECFACGWKGMLGELDIVTELPSKSEIN